MKTMTCKQLGGACNLEFEAETFEDIVEMSKKHGAEMFKSQDAAHIDAMNKMQGMMQNPTDMQNWFEDRRKAFEKLPNH